jgi:hypothetical protein
MAHGAEICYLGVTARGANPRVHIRNKVIQGYKRECFFEKELKVQKKVGQTDPYY